VHVVLVSKALVMGAYQRKLEELARQPGVRLTVIVPPGWKEGGKTQRLERAYTAGYDMLVAPLALNGQFHLHFYPTLGRLLAGLRPDILHMDEEPYNFATWHALRLAAAVGSRSLFFTWQNLERRYPWPFRAFERANYRRAAYALAGNPTAVAVLREKGYAGPVAVIPQFGVDPELFTPAQDGQGREQAARFVIGYAGRLVREKGVDVLLAACARLAGRDWSLDVLGDGPDGPAFKALAGELGIADRVRFLGRVPSTQVVSCYRGLDVLVLPSVSRPNWVEQFGRVLIEAMACETPVVGSTSGEIPYVIGDAGLLFPEADADALAQVLADLAADPARRRALGRQGRARVLAHFTQARIAAATAEVYHEMLNHK
jgi:glycosyltransferase involved in cell wall biosynthesis